MIALDKNLPRTCIGCPCLQTMHVHDVTKNNQGLLIGLCAADKKIIKKIEWEEGDLAPSIEWFDFPKPDWCPWISI